MTKHVLFDLGGVLVNLNYAAFFQSLAELFHTPIDKLRIKAGNQIHFDYMCGKMDGEMYVHKLSDLYNQPVEMDRFLPAWLKIIDGQKDDVAAVINKITSGISLSLLSNTDPWHYRYSMEQYPVMRVFSRFFLSYEYKMMKPDPAFYAAVTKTLNVHPDDCFFIDDTLENIESARAFGWHGIHFQSASQLNNQLISYGII
jgi:FMN phosphatase YigB (HAD superfamily)